jgi:hypothetical protein
MRANLIGSTSLTALAVFLAVTLPAYSQPSPANASDTRPGYFGCTDAKGSAQISIRSSGNQVPWKLEIPYAYLGYSPTWAGGEQRKVRIFTKYPSLEPLPRGTLWNSCAADTKPKNSSEWPVDRLDIDITASNVVGTPLIGFRKPRDEYVEIHSPVGGLKHLQHKCMSTLPWPPERNAKQNDCGYQYWFVPTVQNPSQPLVILCLGVLENPSASCTGNFAYKGHRIEYKYKRAQLQHWAEMNAATLTLLKQFTQ